MRLYPGDSGIEERDRDPSGLFVALAICIVAGTLVWAAIAWAAMRLI